jgi:hypothetical protein
VDMAPEALEAVERSLTEGVTAEVCAVLRGT